MKSSEVIAFALGLLVAWLLFGGRRTAMSQPTPPTSGEPTAPMPTSQVPIGGGGLPPFSCGGCGQ